MAPTSNPRSHRTLGKNFFGRPTATLAPGQLKKEEAATAKWIFLTCVTNQLASVPELAALLASLLEDQPQLWH